MNDMTLLPAIRSHVGDWIFYVTTLSFEDVANIVKAPDEIHERKQLSDWIQREAIEKHADEIAHYIVSNPQRFLGSLIVGVYGGNPNWAPLNIDFSIDYLDVTDKQEQKIEGKLGLLHLSGSEKLFAIDGQHRVAGIKKALGRSDINQDIRDNEISAIFVAHDNSSEAGKQRTRRLFTTVNKKARRISTSAIIALDEDNGFAIVTRRLIDAHWLFEDERKHISYTSTGSISPNDEYLITSVVGLYEIIKDLHPNQNRKVFESERPSEQRLEEYLSFCISYFDALISKVDEYRQVFVKKAQTASDYRQMEKNHLLFRPVGQRTFARAVQLLLSRKMNMNDAVDVLLSANMYISSKEWHHILWDPIDKAMITNKIVLAETQLLKLAGQKPRNNNNGRTLTEFLKSLSE